MGTIGYTRHVHARNARQRVHHAKDTSRHQQCTSCIMHKCKIHCKVPFLAPQVQLGRRLYDLCAVWWACFCVLVSRTIKGVRMQWSLFILACV